MCVQPSIRRTPRARARACSAIVQKPECASCSTDPSHSGRHLLAPVLSGTVLGKRKRGTEDESIDDQDGEERPRKLRGMSDQRVAIPISLTPAAGTVQRPQHGFQDLISSSPQTCGEEQCHEALTTTLSTPSHQAASIISRFPNELIDEILNHLDPPDKACFALTSKSNYTLISTATHKIPRQLCPFEHGCYNPTMLSIQSTTSPPSSSPAPLSRSHTNHLHSRRQQLQNPPPPARPLPSHGQHALLSAARPQGAPVQARAAGARSAVEEEVL